MRTLVLIRHAKSDWSVPLGDQERPLNARGRRQAPRTGEWIGAHLGTPDLAVVSVATRARQTWDLVAAELPAVPPVRFCEDAYTFSGVHLHEVVAALPDHANTVILIGHNPAVEDLIEILTAEWIRMPTAALALVQMASWDEGRGTLRGAGRPADAEVVIDP